MSGPRPVFASDEQNDLEVDVARWSRLLGYVLDEERVLPDAEVALLFVDRDTITGLNAEFLDGEGATDVLAFPIDEDVRPGGRQPDTGGRGPGTPTEGDEPPVLLGDVVICPAVAADNAGAAEKTLDDEIALLVVHGALHLLDYDHVDPAEAEDMQRRERELLDGFATHSTTEGA